MIATLRQRNFALLWTAGLISLIGDWAFYAAMPIFILDRTGSAFQSGLVWAAIALPGIFIGPFAGVYVDRLDRRRIMLFGNVAQAIAATVLLVGGESFGIWLAMAVLLVQSSLYAIYSPAESALLPTVVDEEHLVTANALNSLNDNIARIAGPLIGALVYAWFGIRGIALANMASFLGSAVLVGMVSLAVAARSQSGIDVAATSESIWRSMRTGASVVWHSSVLRSLFMIELLIVLADGPLTAMLAPFVRQTLDRTNADFGVLLSVRGVAGVAGGFVIAHVAHKFRNDRMMGACLLVIGVGVVAIAIIQNYPMTLAIMVLGGPAIVGMNTTFITMLQRNSEDRVRGRIFALLGAFSGVIFLISTVIGSVATKVMSPPAIMLISGLTYTAAGVGALLLLANRRTAQPVEDFVKQDQTGMDATAPTA
ncbi:MAG TPA: MFS transporter [Thermomicrobiales bacterium]|jgi:MFS family permease|nr:MFS transporter [Thermomicrobiales bacterium]